MPHTPLTSVSPERDLGDLVDLVEVASRAAGVGAAHLFWRDADRDRLEHVGGAGSDATELIRLVRGVGPLVTTALERPDPVLVRHGEAGPTTVLIRILGANAVAQGLLALDVGAAPVDSALLGRAMALTEVVGRAARSRTELRSIQRSNDKLRSRARAERRLALAVRDGAGLAALVRECSALTGKPVTLFDAHERQLTRAVPGGAPGTVQRNDGIREILSATGPLDAGVTSVVVAANAGNGLRRSAVLAPVTGSGELFGWLVVDEYPARFGHTDTYAAELAAVHLAAEFVVQRRVARVAWNARSSLARQMVRGSSDPKDLSASAEYLGVDLGVRRVLAHVFEPPLFASPEAQDEQLAVALEKELGAEVLATRGSEGVLLLIEALPQFGPGAMVARVKDALTRTIARLGLSDELIVGVSAVCEPTALSRGYREAREVVRCIDSFGQADGHRVLSSLDLGPARLFLANTKSSAIRSYVADVLGGLLTGEPGTADLLQTLQCYFDHGRSVRTSAAELGVHENTVRLRLARAATATGLDVAGDPNDQLSVQTALLVLRLQGHPVLRSFEPPTPAGVEEFVSEPHTDARKTA